MLEALIPLKVCISFKVKGVMLFSLMYFIAEQLSMRLRFLAASDPSVKNRDDVITTKRGKYFLKLSFSLFNIVSAVSIDEAGVSEEQIKMRKKAEEEVSCFVTLGNPHIYLLVHSFSYLD